MAMQVDAGIKEEVKCQFSTVEGVYKVVPVAEYGRPNRLAYNNTGNSGPNPPVRVSFLCMPDSRVHSINNDEKSKICFNYGRELYVYSYKGVHKAVDLTKPIEKRSYSKEEAPTCHDFNSISSDGGKKQRVSLLIGLHGGQVQLIDPVTKEINKSYNSGDRLIDKSKVTCVRWVPGSTNQFLVSHDSGNMYLYNEEIVCSVDKPHYQLFKQGEDFSIYTCKTKTTRNPLYRWVVGNECAINEFAFSPCSKYLALVSQDGFLRIFNFDTMDLVGSCRSYYGGLICVCWSPDGRYVVCGGEDDLLTIWSFNEKRVVARGEGHKSWVTVVAFDPYTTLYGEMDGMVDIHNENTYNRKKSNYNNENCSNKVKTKANPSSRPNSVLSDGLNATCYRLGSVSQDTFLCLWDLKDDYLRQSYYRPRSSTVVSSSRGSTSNTCSSPGATSTSQNSAKTLNDFSNHTQSANSLTSRLASLNFGDKKVEKEHKRNLSLGIRNHSGNGTNKKENKQSAGSGVDSSSRNHIQSSASSTKGSYPVGTPQCPKLDECPILEPMVCKKIGHERLTSLIFREDAIVTACQDGCIHTWCRPGKQVNHQRTSLSPPESHGGTVV